MSGSNCFERICAIVAGGQGSKVLKLARSHGIPGGTILRGHGTAGGRLLEFLGLSEMRWEVVTMVAGRDVARSAMEKLADEFQLARPNHGIAFSTRVYALAGSKHCPPADQEDEREDLAMFHVITVVVDKGLAEDVVESARRAGAKGGTILNGRGAGVHETKKLFNMDIEPEREMVLIIAEIEKSAAIIEAIRSDMRLDEPGRGILFAQEVVRAYGIHV